MTHRTSRAARFLLVSVCALAVVADGRRRCFRRTQPPSPAVAVGALRADAPAGEVRRPDAHDHAFDSRLGGLRAVALRAGEEPGDRRAVHLCGGRLRGDRLQAADRPARHAARSAGALGAGVRGDRRAAADLRGQAARGDLDRRAGEAGLQLPPAGLRHPAVGAPARPHPGGERRDGALGLVEALARSGARAR